MSNDDNRLILLEEYGIEPSEHEVWVDMPTEVRGAYDLWRHLGRPPFARIARLLNVQQGAIRKWAREYEWERRANDPQDVDDISFSDSLAQIASMRSALLAEAYAFCFDPSNAAIARQKMIEALLDRGGLTTDVATGIVSGDIGMQDREQTIDMNDPEAVLRELRRTVSG